MLPQAQHLQNIEPAVFPHQKLRNDVTIDINNLPFLESSEFTAVVDWYIAVGDILRRFHPQPTIRVAAIIALPVLDTFEAIAEQTLDSCPELAENFEKATYAMLTQFQPSSFQAHLAILKQLSWTQPPRPDLSALTTLMAYNRHASLVYDVLEVSPTTATKMYISSIGGDTGRLLGC